VGRGWRRNVLYDEIHPSDVRGEPTSASEEERKKKKKKDMEKIIVLRNFVISDNR
jgi:hypothetical protein